MSFSREGWKAKKLITQVCCDCLSRRTPAIVVRRLTTKSQVPASLEKFRKELYNPQDTNDTLRLYSPLVRKAISRREERERLLSSWRKLHKNCAQYITEGDIDTMLSKLKTNSNDASFNIHNCQEAFDILQDVKKGKLPMTFRQQDLEYMIYLSTELNWTKKSLVLLGEGIKTYGELDIECFENVFRLFVRQQRKKNYVDYWIHYLEEKEIWTRSILNSIVLYKIGQGQIEQAALYIRKYSKLDIVNKYTIEQNRELIDQVLNIYAMDNIKQWKLNDTRFSYKIKKSNQLSTTTIIKNLMDKCLYTGQIHVGNLLLMDTIKLEDINNIQLCSKKLMEYYLSRNDIKHSVEIWELLQKNGYFIQKELMEKLLLKSSKLKYSIDTMRIYQHYIKLYPQHGDEQVQTHVLKCMIRSKDFKNAYRILPTINIDNMKLSNARIIIKSLFSLSAQTGNLELFESSFNTSEKLKLSLKHKGLTSLVACYLKRGDVRSAKAAFQSVAEHTDGPDVVDFNLLMRTVVLEDKGVNYDKIFDILKHMNLVNVTPDETTMRTMLKFYSSESDMQKSLYEKLLNNTEAISRFNHVYLNNIALKSLLTTKSVVDVYGLLARNNRQELFPTLEEKDVIHVNGITWNILLKEALKDIKHTSLVEKIIQDMSSRGMKPTAEVYQLLIKHLSRKGKIAKAKKYIYKMESETGEKSTFLVWNHLLQELILQKKYSSAQEIIKQDMMNIQLDVKTKKILQL